MIQRLFRNDGDSCDNPQFNRPLRQRGLGVIATVTAVISLFQASTGLTTSEVAMSSKRLAFTPEQCGEFARAADPHQWLLTADSLHRQAVALYQQRGRGQIVQRTPGQPPVSWDDTNRATFLLAAFALENALKAFLVYEHPGYVADGFLSKEICSHRLVALSKLSSQIPYRIRDECVLAAFEAGNESWMRYPCGRDANSLQPEAQLTDLLWSGYRRVARGYGLKLKRLLQKGWNGPHDCGGTWQTTFDWLA